VTLSLTHTHSLALFLRRALSLSLREAFQARRGSIFVKASEARIYKVSGVIYIYMSAAPIRQSEFRRTKPFTCNADSILVTSQRCWEFECFTAAAMINLCDETLSAAKRDI